MPETFTITMTKTQAAKIRAILRDNAVGKGEYLNCCRFGCSDSQRLRKMKMDVVDANRLSALFNVLRSDMELALDEARAAITNSCKPELGDRYTE